MTERQTSDWLAADEVDAILNAATRDDGRIRAALQKARELKGLDMADVAALCHIAAPEQIEELFATARSVKAPGSPSLRTCNAFAMKPSWS